MRLGINGWRIHGQRTGIGRYLLSIVSRWDSAAVNGRFEEVVFYTPRPLDPQQVTLPENIRVRVVAPDMRLLAWENLLLGPLTRDSVLWGPSYSRPVLGRSRNVVTTHDATQYVHPEIFPKSVHRVHSPLYRWSAQHSAKVIASSEASRADIIEYMGVPASSVITVPLAPAEIFQHQPDDQRDAEVRKRHLGTEDPYFLFVGKMTGRRNVPLLLESFATFKRESGARHKLLLVGLKSHEKELAIQLEELGIGAQVFHCGFVNDEELNAVYNAAEALIMPSTYETISLPVMEAQATATPVIAVDTAGSREITGGEALLMPTFTVEHAAAAMAQIASDAPLRERLGRLGHANAQRFSWDRTARETLDVLYDVARN